MIFEEKKYKGIDFKKQKIEKGEYIDCIFENCSFSGSDLTDINFIDCEFKECDMSMANLTNASLQNISFKNCKLLGLHYESCKDLMFSVSFENCLLNLSSFYRRNLQKMCFEACQLNEVDFTETNLTEAKFNNCDLSGAIFESSILEKADFRTATNYIIDPNRNKVKKAKFSLSGAVGLLNSFDIIIE